MSSSRKRKNRPGAHVLQEETENSPDPALFIQAHEADILRGSQAKQAADSLEVNKGHPVRPGGLIQLNSSNLTPVPFPNDAEDDFISTAKDRTTKSVVWVDRYDARLLLDALPKFAPQQSPPSPSGWSDLPSDTEDTFFFSPHEAEDYRREKRRKLMDEAREARLKARKAEDGEPEEDEADIWGGSDEEPDEAQAALMRRTAASIVAAADPLQLEMRILASYGGDKRFAFLRGRWKDAWVAIKRSAEKEEEAKKSSAPADGLGNLADYGDSDEEEEEEEPIAKPEPELAARQARAKAWAEARRAPKSKSDRMYLINSLLPDLIGSFHPGTGSEKYRCVCLRVGLT
ncbi:hypothetical protein B0H17DRAFT_1331914 [Mycena rosella]|uniref:Uncharacterized protein n=1 Tax=Mycena rosella TaxID=1033263 RepID=A0AAD7DDG0_MYCRO|nr:hypothetical protein B0H17DRAFT_1331914 [Mycena rosella]